MYFSDHIWINLISASNYFNATFQYLGPFSSWNTYPIYSYTVVRMNECISGNWCKSVVHIGKSIYRLQGEYIEYILYIHNLYFIWVDLHSMFLKYSWPGIDPMKIYLHFQSLPNSQLRWWRLLKSFLIMTNACWYYSHYHDWWWLSEPGHQYSGFHISYGQW